jgi:hypothetical protein
MVASLNDPACQLANIFAWQWCIRLSSIASSAFSASLNVDQRFVSKRSVVTSVCDVGVFPTERRRAQPSNSVRDFPSEDYRAFPEVAYQQGSQPIDRLCLRLDGTASRNGDGANCLRGA